MTKNDLTIKVNYQSIASISFPLYFALLIPQISFIINSYFLGLLGLEALAVAGVVSIYYFVLAILAHGLNSGLQNLMSIAAGKNDTLSIEKIFFNGTILGIGVSVLCVGLSFLFTSIIFDFFLDKKLAKLCSQYMNIRILGLPLYFIYQLRNSLFIVLKKKHFLIYITLFETSLNIGLDYIFIFGRLGLPKKGINGVAIASILTEFGGIIFVYFLYFSFKLNRLVKLKFVSKIDFFWLKKIIINSYPLMLQYFISVINFEFFSLLISTYGIQALAITNLMRLIFGIAGSFGWALAFTTNNMVSNLVGQKKIYQIRVLKNLLIRFGLVMISVISGLLILLNKTIISLYQNNLNFYYQALPVYLILCLSMFFMIISNIMNNTVIGLGKAKIILYSEIISIFFYLSYTFISIKLYVAPLYIVWINEIIYWLILIIPSFFYILYFFKKRYNNLTLF